jgi:hypothetical protein
VDHSRSGQLGEEKILGPTGTQIPTPQSSSHSLSELLFRLVSVLYSMSCYQLSALLSKLQTADNLRKCDLQIRFTIENHLSG